MANVIYNSFKKNIMNGSLDLDGDTIKVMLLSSAYQTDVVKHAVKTDVAGYEITGTGYVAGGQALPNKVVVQDDVLNQGKFDAGDVNWAASTLTARYAVIYKDTGNAATSPLICCFDLGTDRSSVNNNFTIQWHAEGILNLA